MGRCRAEETGKRKRLVRRASYSRGRGITHL
jgi:hypothetical protein